MKSIQLVVSHPIHKFFHGFHGNKIPGRVQHETSISKEWTINDSTGGNDLHSVSLFVKCDKLAESFWEERQFYFSFLKFVILILVNYDNHLMSSLTKTMTSSEKGVTSNLGSHNISLSLNVNSITLRGFQGQSFFWVVDNDLRSQKRFSLSLPH